MKTTEQIYRNMHMFIRKLNVRQNVIFCCCLATKNVQSNKVNVIVVFAFMGQLCIQTTSPTTNIFFQRNVLHLELILPLVQIS